MGSDTYMKAVLTVITVCMFTVLLASCATGSRGTPACGEVTSYELLKCGKWLDLADPLVPAEALDCLLAPSKTLEELSAEGWLIVSITLGEPMATPGVRKNKRVSRTSDGAGAGQWSGEGGKT